MRGLLWYLAGLGALLALAGASTVGATPPWAADPIFVFYPRGDCRGDALDLEIWDRESSAWRPHPGHPRVPLETCQLEDAGVLFNEIRLRCVEPVTSEPPAPWMIGLDVFDPAVVETCAVEQRAEPTGNLGLHIVTPAPGERVTAPRMEVAIQGAVRMDGIDGTDYDLVLVIDRSAGTRDGGVDLFAAQLEAARSLLARLAPRLGPVRIGIASYPNMPSLPGSIGGTGARRVVPLTDDVAMLERGLRELRNRGVSGFQTFGSALDFALAELEGRHPGAGARSGARKLLVIAANAAGERPFGPAAARDPRFMSQLEQRLQHARKGRMALHLFAMGGLSEELPPSLRDLFDRTGAHFHRVLRPALARPFFSRVPLPLVTAVVVANRTLGSGETSAGVTRNGRFSTTLAASAGINQLWARVTLSDGATAEREWAFEFDDTIVRERLIAEEREH
ncbi:MAG: VWA domain-containing protein, partial [Proteobacteria bacterium]|nr:VWA domain-containing protein [Pseudomonadota bacterium]